MTHRKTCELPLILTDTRTGYKKELVIKTFLLPNGLTDSFFINKDKDSVQILPITPDNQVICVRQFRPHSEKQELELPGGGFDYQNEDPVLAAERELLEETAYKGTLQFISKVPYNPYSSGMRYLFIATNCMKHSKQLDLDPNEFLEVKLISLSDFYDMCLKTQIRGWDLGLIGFNILKLP